MKELVRMTVPFYLLMVKDVNHVFNEEKLLLPKDVCGAPVCKELTKLADKHQTKLLIMLESIL